MKMTRRGFIGGGVAGTMGLISGCASTPKRDEFGDQLEAVTTAPVLNTDLFKDPVVIESMELLKKGREYFVRARAKGGAEGISVDNGRAGVIHPIINGLVNPYFVGKDARDLEEHLFQVYRHRDNYKYQGLALWCAVALAEFAILDLLGRIVMKPIYELLGGPALRDRVPFYIASGRRDTTPEQEIEYLQKLIEETGAKAVKYRLGGRMNRNVDALPRRTEGLIPLSRKALGDKIAIHADSNSSYDAAEAIRIGRMLEEIEAVFYEEPCPFDDFHATKQVTDALRIPIALGEQESSEARFADVIRERVADIVQPDLFYYGGLIRSARVARMALLRNMPTTAHISGGFGFVYMLHFAACTPKIGPWQEYKEGVKQYAHWFNPALKIVDGAITVPRGPGVGVVDVDEVLKGAEIVKS